MNTAYRPELNARRLMPGKMTVSQNGEDSMSPGHVASRCEHHEVLEDGAASECLRGTGLTRSSGPLLPRLGGRFGDLVEPDTA